MAFTWNLGFLSEYVNYNYKIKKSRKTLRLNSALFSSSGDKTLGGGTKSVPLCHRGLIYHYPLEDPLLKWKIGWILSFLFMSMLPGCIDTEVREESQVPFLALNHIALQFKYISLSIEGSLTSNVHASMA